MPAKQPPAPNKTMSAVRIIGPAIPLAIALAHSAISPNPTPPQQVSQATITNSTAPFAPEATLSGKQCGGGTPESPACPAPYPMLQKGHPVDWWFVFKFNTASFPGCGEGATRACPFGGTPQTYKLGQQFAYASSEAPALQKGSGCVGANSDPVAASFDEVYNGNYHYVIWNDQFKTDPKIKSCGADNSCGAPWGHSKGMLAWNDDGEGFIMQVSTPSWPGAGNVQSPRKDGNTLGCVKDDDVEVSQHFFALRLNKDDLVQVLNGLINASVVTDASNSQIVRNGGPADVQQLVSQLGQISKANSYLATTLSSGVELISKSSKLQVPPWQMVSAVLGGAPLRVASWWETPAINSTDANSTVGCWSPVQGVGPALGKPGPVEIATSGHWESTTFGLTGGASPNMNHAKVGVTTGGPQQYAIFGDMNQQGSLSGPNCASSQNGRGGMFFVVAQPQLAASVTELLKGSSGPVQPAGK